MSASPGRRLTRRRFLVGASAAAAAAAAGVWAASQALRPGPPSAHPSATPSAGPRTGPPPSPAQALKPALQGLLSLDPTPSPPSLRVSLAGYVVSRQGREGALDWADLQGSALGPLVHPNPIDTAIAEVRTWNAAHPGQPPQRLKLRCHGGIRAPADVMDAGGPHFLSRDQGFNTPERPCPRFWTDQYASAWYDFQSRLAAAYDGVDEVAEIVAARCMLQYAEPFLRFAADAFEVEQLRSAGFDSDRDRQQQLEDLQTMATIWKRTRIGFAINPYQQVTPRTAIDMDFTRGFITSARQALGAQLSLENDSLRPSFVLNAGNYHDMYAAMAADPGPKGIQTAVASRVENLPEAVRLAGSGGGGQPRVGASHVELPGGYASTTTPAQLQEMARSVAGTG